jgi:myosin protein heavy chain
LPWQLQELANLFIAGDANQDGVLTFTEFREILSTANPAITTQSALRMFRETLLLMPDGGDSISPQAFATVAHSHGISAPARVVFELLEKTWNQASLMVFVCVFYLCTVYMPSIKHEENAL